MNPSDLIKEYYRPGSRVYEIVLTHARKVSRRALEAAQQAACLNPDPVFPDLVFIEEAAMLHDIAMFMTDMPKLGCYGMHPYICHGILGRRLLEEKGLKRHALVCERHIGTGIRAEDIRSQGLPLPVRDMVPLSLEEEIIAYADKFFSKDPKYIFREHRAEDIIRKMAQYGPDKAETFRLWHKKFGKQQNTAEK